MTRAIPHVGDHMTRSPHTIGAEQSLERACAKMRELGVRHLPVLHGGKLVGVVTDRDLHLVESLEGVDPRLVTVSDAMSGAVYAVSPDASLETVARHMGEHKLGSAVVLEHGEVVGIFTTVDVCRALADALHARRTS